MWRSLESNLTHWDRNKMAAFFQTIFLNAFSAIKSFEFRLSVHWKLFPGVQLTLFQHCFRWWLGAGQATSHYLKQWWLVYWRIYASIGLNELTDTLIFCMTSLRMKPLLLLPHHDGPLLLSMVTMLMAHAAVSNPLQHPVPLQVSRIYTIVIRLISLEGYSRVQL